jgi:predicted small lipoprotein YifL
VLIILNKRTLIVGLSLIGNAVLLSACGQKGPLYLPVKPQQSNIETTQVQAQTPTDASKKTP